MPTVEPRHDHWRGRCIGEASNPGPRPPAPPAALSVLPQGIQENTAELNGLDLQMKTDHNMKMADLPELIEPNPWGHLRRKSQAPGRPRCKAGDLNGPDMKVQGRDLEEMALNRPDMEVHGRDLEDTILNGLGLKVRIFAGAVWSRWNLPPCRHRRQGSSSVRPLHG